RDDPAVDALDRLWAKTSKNGLKPWVRCAIRIVALYSASGDVAHRDEFEKAMRDEGWKNEIDVGMRRYWFQAVLTRQSRVEEILNSLGSRAP
ncbi:MAG: hypothetical protein K8I02_04815, partial [Candidatus Methylomirabilis sp.]|nr:hypothetical protein [Deltaproteobacteria bacterium]